MKKMLMFIVLTVLLFVLCGCQETVQEAAELKNPSAHAMILMPDGTIIEGTCTDRFRMSNNWQTVVIDGVKYRVHEWRLAITEE